MKTWRIRHLAPRLIKDPLPLYGFSIGYVDLPGIQSEKDQIKRRDYHLIGWVGHGELTALQGRKRIPLTAGQAIILPPGKPTGFYAERETYYYYIKCDGSHFTGILKGLKLQCSRAYNAGPPPIALMEQLRQELTNMPYAGEFACGATAYHILSRLAYGQARYASGMDGLVNDAMDHLRKNWGNVTLNISVLADELGVHRTLLAQRFKRATGSIPSEYLRNLRVHQALSMLENTLIPITEIGPRCGYPDPTQFSRLIKKATGLSPREIRGGMR